MTTSEIEYRLEAGYELPEIAARRWSREQDGEGTQETERNYHATDKDAKRS